MAEWWTAPAEGDNGGTVMVTGRKDVDRFRKNPRFNICVEVAWPYSPESDGMPGIADSELMEKAQEALEAVFAKDPVAVLTGIITGENVRTWVFYTLSTHIFGRKLNEALADLPVLPLEISTFNDPEWAQYAEMSECEINLD